ncbi:unnamed protein product [Cladocopium goreaui]|uniref:Carboxypeptidase T n=1 Tax=Cladocopium goreaui TaxID=2562237 RepID=A0A9P1DER7_9DINO|nr:unnamed protein product [Cladocopium goreaui]|mmetsp:Transcript_850/g.1914  ORF Transcript_850/g.1914 Transcript_850/m.1914 type:complete len:636 (+) Transcript_850:47-1954(+)
MLWRCCAFLAFIALPSKSSWTEKLDHGSVSGFPSYEEANKLLQQFLEQHPNELTKQQIGESYQKRPIYAYILGTKSGRQRHPPQVLLTSLTHAREPASLTVLMYFLGHLLDEFKAGDAQASYILEMREVWLVPFVNPDGYVANQGLRSKVIRKNLRPTCRSAVNGGVDINRNFGVHWSGGFNGCNEEHGGTQPFSEPETRALQKICEENSFKTAMNFHAFGSMLTHPYNWANTDLLPADDKAVYKEIAKVFGWKKFGTAIQTVGYTATGESDDWMYSKRHIISMSPEVGPEYGGFWPPSSEIAGIDSRNFERTSYVVLKAGMELKVEAVRQSLGEFLQRESRPPGLENLAGGIPDKLFQLRIDNLGLSPSSGQVLRVGVHGAVKGTPGDPGLLLQDGKTTQLAANDGTVSLQVNSIDKRSSKTVWIIPARSWEIELGAMTVCVSEVDSDSSIRAICHCSASGRESFAFPDATAGLDRLDSRICAAALHGGVSPAGSTAPLATTIKEAPHTSPTTSLQLDSRTSATTMSPTADQPFFQIASSGTTLLLGEKHGKQSLIKSPLPKGEAESQAVFATWLLLALGATFVGMFACLFMQSFVVPRAVARRAPSAVDYERIPGLQVSRAEDSDDLGFSPQA